MNNKKVKNKKKQSLNSGSALDLWSAIIEKRTNTNANDIKLSDILPNPCPFAIPPMNYREIKNITNLLERSLGYLALARHYSTENSPEWINSRIDDLEKACKINFENIILNPISKLMGVKNYCQALNLLLTHIEKETAEKPLGARFYYYIAICYLNTGKFDKAKEHAEEAINRSQDEKLTNEINNLIINFNRLKSNYFIDNALKEKKANKQEFVWSQLREAENADPQNAIVHYYIAEWLFSDTVRDIKDKKVSPTQVDFLKPLASLRKAEELNNDAKLTQAILNLRTQIQKVQSQLHQV